MATKGLFTKMGRKDKADKIHVLVRKQNDLRRISSNLPASQDSNTTATVCRTDEIRRQLGMLSSDHRALVYHFSLSFLNPPKDLLGFQGELLHLLQAIFLP